MMESLRMSSCLNLRGSYSQARKRDSTTIQIRVERAEKNFTDDVISNIRGDVMALKDISNWVLGCLHNLNPSNAKNSLISNVYVLAV
jgi:hypothetical protein